MTSNWRRSKLPDYWTVNREDLGTRLNCFGSEYKIVEHFTLAEHFQGAEKVIFKACHSGKLKLAYTNPNVISTNPKTFWWGELISQFFCNLNSSKDFTCPSGKLRTEFIVSPIAKSTSSGLLDTTFFARWFHEGKIGELLAKNIARTA